MASGSSVALTEPSSEFSIGASARSTSPPAHGDDDSWTVASGTARRVAARRRLASSASLGERALRAEVADAHQRVGRSRRGVAATSPASRQRAHRLVLLGRELELAVAAG